MACRKSSSEMSFNNSDISDGNATAGIKATQRQFFGYTIHIKMAAGIRKDCKPGSTTIDRTSRDSLLNGLG